MAEDATDRRQRSRMRRWLIATAGLFAAATLVGLAPWAMRRIEEEMCLRRLDLPESHERDAAIRRLGELRSERAVPRLVEIAMGEEWQLGPAGAALLAVGPPAVEPLLTRAEGDPPAEASRPARRIPGGSSEDLTAMRILGAFGPESLQPFLKATSHPIETRRELAIRWLANTVAEDPRAFDAFVSALDDPTQGIRLAAAKGLFRAGNRRVEAATHLLRRLEDANEGDFLKREVAHLFPQLGEVGIHTLREMLDHRDERLRLHAADALVEADPDLRAKCVSVLEAGLASADPLVRHQSLIGLDRALALGTERLARFLSDPDPSLRSEALSRLDKRNAAPEAIQELRRYLREQSADRWRAARLLGRLGPRARDAVPDLLQALERDTHGESSEEILLALGQISPDATDAVPALTRALATDCPAAAEALGRVGLAAVTAGPALAAALADSSCAANAVEALVRLGPAVVPDLLPVFASTDPMAKQHAVRVLHRLGPGAAAATETLAAQLGAEPESPVELDAVRALGRIGPAAQAALPQLVRVLEHRLASGRFRRIPAMAEAIGHIGPAALGTAPLLRRAAATLYADIRSHALLALGRIGAGDAESLEAMRQGLRSQLKGLRVFAALALLHMPGEEIEARAALARLPAEELLQYGLINALPNHSEETEALLPQLTSLLTMERREMTTVCAILGELGPRGGTALPALERLHAEQLAHPSSVDARFVEAVEEALRLLRAASKRL